MEITVKGSPKHVEGTVPAVGQTIPHFSVTDTKGITITNADLEDRVTIISVFPDIETRVCDAQTRHFHERVNQEQGIAMLSISTNTKEQLDEWCAAKGLDIVMVSDTERSFGKAFGLYIPEMDKFARAVFVISQEGLLAYKEVLKEMSDEPNYDAAIEAAKDLADDVESNEKA